MNAATATHPDRDPSTYRYALMMQREVQFDVATPPPVFTTYTEAGDTVPVVFRGKPIFMAFLHTEEGRNALCQRGWRDVTAEYRAEADARTFKPVRDRAEFRTAVMAKLSVGRMRAGDLKKALGQDPSVLLVALVAEKTVVVEEEDGKTYYRVAPPAPIPDGPDINGSKQPLAGDCAGPGDTLSAGA